MQNEKTAYTAKTCKRKILRTRKDLYVHEIPAVNSSKIYFLKNTEKTCKPNSRNLNRD